MEPRFSFLGAHRVLCAETPSAGRSLRGQLSRLVALALLVPFSIGWSPVHTSGPARSSPVDQIVFVSDRDFFAHVYVMDPDGSGETQLTTGDTTDRAPRWSPDHAHILFQRLGGQECLCIMNTDGSGLRRVPLPPRAHVRQGFSWSPDGHQIVFDAVGPGFATSLVIVGSDGSGLHKVIADGEFNTMPDWSPRGDRIVFVRGTPNSLWTIKPDGSDLTELTTTDDYLPRWSPDGSRIVFERRTYPGSDIWVMNADGSNPVNLTSSSATYVNDWPAFSRDGSQIIFNRRLVAGSGYDLYTMTADGSNLRQLTTDGHSFSPDW